LLFDSICMWFADAMNENICHREFGPKRSVGAGGKSTGTPSCEEEGSREEKKRDLGRHLDRLALIVLLHSHRLVLAPGSPISLPRPLWGHISMLMIKLR